MATVTILVKYMYLREIRVKLIKQHDNKSCGRACVAMAAGIPYAELNFETTGRTYETMNDVLLELVERRIPVLPTAGIGYVSSDTAILAVPSLNVIGGMHWIYARYGDIYDPQEGRIGMKFYTNKNPPLSSGEIIVINPANPEELINLVRNNTGMVTAVQYYY